MRSKAASNPENLLDELQATLAHGTVTRRIETLRRVTDLFINGAIDYSDEQIELFDDVFQCLILHIESSAKTLLANRLAPIDTAPPRTSARWRSTISSRLQLRFCRNRAGLPTTR